MNRLLANRGPKWKIRGPDDLASLPLLLLLSAILSFVASPIENGISRYFEHQADIYGLEVIHGIVPDPQTVAVQSFQRLGEIDLSDPNPSPLIKIWLFSHPPITERIEFARSYDPWSKGQAPRFVK
jgi:Zn-dependent protease with chaperone function